MTPGGDRGYADDHVLGTVDGFLVGRDATVAALILGLGPPRGRNPRSIRSSRRRTTPSG